jgi:hypothetical protein
MSSAFAFHVVCVWYGLKSAPTHHNHSLTTGPIFGVQLILKVEGIGTKTLEALEPFLHLP